MYVTYRDPPHTASPFTRKIWEEHKHLAKVSRATALRRVQKGWSILDAITTPPVTEDQSDSILAFLEKHPLSSRETVAKAIKKSSSTTLKFLESLERDGRVYKTIGKTAKNRPIYFYGIAGESTAEPIEVFDIEEEKNWKPKTFVNKIRQRALDDLEKLKKMKQK